VVTVKVDVRRRTAAGNFLGGIVVRHNGLVGLREARTCLGVLFTAGHLENELTSSPRFGFGNRFDTLMLPQNPIHSRSRVKVDLT
jgi:hypothetical protein